MGYPRGCAARCCRSLVQRAGPDGRRGARTGRRTDPGQPTQLLEDARALVSGYYAEDPARSAQCCNSRWRSGSRQTLLRGTIDRIDVAATRLTQIVDYKTSERRRRRAGRWRSLRRCFR